MSRLLYTCPIALLLAACGREASKPAGETHGEDTARPNVLLIVIDTLRRDHLSCYGYEHRTSPNLDALAETGVRYERALSQAPWTTPSVGSLMSSSYPSSLGILGERAAVAAEEELMAELLGAAGYKTAAAISHTFCSSTWGFDQGFDRFDESNVQGHAAVTSEGVTDRALEYLRQLDEVGGPFFLWTHYFDPHCAYVEHDGHPFSTNPAYEGPVQSGQLFRELQELRHELKPKDLAELRRIYDSEIAFTDAQVGRLLAALDELGLAENTLVIVTADHGEEFQDHGELGHAKSLYEELVGVPLIVRYPGGAQSNQPRVERRPVGLIDLLPTVLDVTGVAAHARLEGISLAPGSEGLDATRSLFTETARRGGIRAVVRGHHKLIYNVRGQRSELYDLVGDPGETNDLTQSQAGDLTELRATLEAELERFRTEIQAEAGVAPDVVLDTEAAEHLKSIGYGGSDEDQ